MTTVYLGLGSNVEPEKHLRLAMRELNGLFHLTLASSVWRSAPLGFEGDDFLNAVVAAETKLSPDSVCAELERIHDLAGRVRSTDAYVSRTLDIDLLMYGQQVIQRPPVRVPRGDILEYGFVLGPLAEIAPDLLHPVTGKTIAAHWAAFDKDAHPMQRVDFYL